MDDDLTAEFLFDDEFLLEEEYDPFEVAVCQALYPVFSGIFARELVQALDG